MTNPRCDTSPLQVNKQSNHIITDTFGTRNSVRITECPIKQLNFKENVWSGTKKTVCNNKCLY